MNYREKLESMARECGFDWDTVKHLPLMTFANLLDACRKAKEKNEPNT